MKLAELSFPCVQLQPKQFIDLKGTQCQKLLWISLDGHRQAFTMWQWVGYANLISYICWIMIQEKWKHLKRSNLKWVVYGNNRAINIEKFIWCECATENSLYQCSVITSAQNGCGTWLQLVKCRFLFCSETRFQERDAKYMTEILGMRSFRNDAEKKSIQRPPYGIVVYYKSQLM